jgi:serine acetyltransferase
VINDRAVIGKNVILRHCTTIGVKKKDGGCPVIGNDVNIGSNVVILGDILIGDGAVVGAGSVVIKDVPPFAVVAGNPARVIRILRENERAKV